MCGSALRAAAVTLQTSHCDSGHTNARRCPHDHVRLVSCSWDTYVSSAPSVDRRLDATSSPAGDRATCRLVKALASHTHAKRDTMYLLQFHAWCRKAYSVPTTAVQRLPECMQRLRLCTGSIETEREDDRGMQQT